MKLRNRIRIRPTPGVLALIVTGLVWFIAVAYTAGAGQAPAPAAGQAAQSSAARPNAADKKLLAEEAFVAGIIVGFCPYRFTHAAGHLSIVSTQWIPFFFLYVERLISTPRVKNAVLTAVFFSLCACTTWYYFFMVPIAAVLYAAFRVNWAAVQKERSSGPARSAPPSARQSAR